MPTVRDLKEKLSQWDQVAVIVAVIVLSQLAATLWLDASGPPAAASASTVMPSGAPTEPTPGTSHP